MPARSMTNQGLYLQKETTPGTAATSAMKRVLGLRATPGYTVEGEDHKASGYKVNTSRVVNTEMGTWSAEAIQDYNAGLWLLCGMFGAPTSGLVSGGTLAYEHLFDLRPREADPKATFTAMWGDPTKALQATYAVFQNLGLTINRNSLSLDTGLISREPVTGIALPTTGVVEVPSVPIAARSWDGFADTAWDDLGTTKLLALYEGSITAGDKYTPDWVVNSAVPSFSEMLEAEDTEYSANFRLGFDATAEAVVADYKAGTLKFLRFQSLGPIIESTTRYELTLDFCVRITNPGEVGAAPNSPAVTLPFDAQLTVDPVSGKVATGRVVNTISGL